MTVLEQLQARNAVAQAELRARLFAKVVATCERLLGDSARAKDMAEDTWTDFLFGEVDRVREPQAIAAYLRMMAVRRCLRLRRVESRFEILDDEGESAWNADLAPPVEADTVAHIDDVRAMGQMHRCMQKLTDRERRILRLRFLHTKTLAEIGQSEGITKQYVGQIIKSSLQRLKRCMGSWI